MIAPSVTADYMGKPLEELQRLIAKRQQFCYECARDAVVGTAITVLRSIRALTRDAHRRTKFNVEVADTGFYGGYSATERCRVVRQGVSRYSQKVKMDGKVVWLTPPGTRQYLNHIYRIVPEHRPEKNKPYYVCAYSAGDARGYEMKRIRRGIARTGGLALNTLSAAMAQLSTRNDPMVGSSIARSLAGKYSLVTRNGKGEEFAVTVLDNLDYAVSALKGGRPAVGLAMMRAANKVSGWIRHYVHLPLGADVPTPFPEIVRSR